MLQQTSYDSVRIISLDRDELLSRLQLIAQRIRAEHPEVADVRVFGSIARGDHVGTSDVDVLIVLHEYDGRDPIERVRTFYRYFDLPIDVDILVFTREQLKRRLKEGDAPLESLWQHSQTL